MSRAILAADDIHPAVRDKVANYNRQYVDEVKAAVERDAIVVVGMKQNPHPRRARRLLKDKGLTFTYLEYGSYLNDWRKRLALKLWTGWPTFPMIFVKGTFIGGADELEKLLDSGELDTLLS